MHRDEATTTVDWHWREAGDETPKKRKLLTQFRIGRPHSQRRRRPSAPYVGAPAIAIFVGFDSARLGHFRSLRETRAQRAHTRTFGRHRRRRYEALERCRCPPPRTARCYEDEAAATATPKTTCKYFFQKYLRYAPINTRTCRYLLYLCQLQPCGSRRSSFVGCGEGGTTPEVVGDRVRRSEPKKYRLIRSSTTI